MAFRILPDIPLKITFGWRHSYIFVGIARNPAGIAKKSANFFKEGAAPLQDPSALVAFPLHPPPFLAYADSLSTVQQNTL
jgi:hypothetical protein